MARSSNSVASEGTVGTAQARRVKARIRIRLASRLKLAEDNMMSVRTGTEAVPVFTVDPTILGQKCHYPRREVWRLASVLLAFILDSLPVG